MTLQEILSRLHGVHGSGKQYTARCPAHDDHNASLSIGQGEDGKILLHCHAGCDVENILAALGLKKADLFNKSTAAQDFGSVTRSGAMQAATEEDTYIYRDGNNIPILRKVRVRKPDGGKSFYWQYLDNGQWKKGRNGQAAPLYRQSDLTGAHAVYLVEGEKDVKTLERNGLRAVSPPDGAKSKWREEYTAELAGHNVVILQDNDDPGKAFARMAAGELSGVAKSVKVIDLTKDWPELPEHGDISDVLVLFPDGDPLGKLLKRVEIVPEWRDNGQAEGAPEKIDYSRLIAKSAAEIDFSQTPTTTFYIDGIIAQGLTFLNAFSKVGKSRVILQMLLAICRGLSFFGKSTKKCYDQHGIDELAESIEVIGLQQPLVVVPEKDRYCLLAGHRRRNALVLLGRETAPCRILDADLDPSLRVLILHWTNTMARGGAGLKGDAIAGAAKEIEAALTDLKQRGVVELPGKLRAYVAEVMKVSEATLARAQTVDKQ